MSKNKKKTALFLCNCGTNIANFVNLEEIANWAKAKGDVDIIESHNLLCSPAGKKFFKEKLKETQPESIVIGACSPKMHEKTFCQLTEESGMNLAQIHMTNLREQCAWVTKDDKGKATDKAKSLLSASFKRVNLHENLERKSMDCLTDILIIGGGIAGIEAAITASRAGRKVYLVDKDVSIGGSIIKTEEVAPNMECAPCLLAPRLSEIRDDSNITVISNAEVQEILGFYGNFTAKINKKARFVKDNCIGCEACFEVCPVSVKSKFHLGLGDRKAIYTQFPGSVPAAAMIDKENCKHFIDNSCNLCVESCPFESIDFEQKDELIEISIGAIVIATGFESGDSTSLAHLNYGKIDNIYTLPEFERLASSNGPTGGTVKLKNEETPSTIAVVHCAGSMKEDGIPYCSGTCCVTASKVGEQIRKQDESIKVYNIHNNLVFSGPAQDRFYKHQIKEGTNYIKCDDPNSLEISQSGKQIKISGSGIKTIKVDMVVLATGFKPSSSTKTLAEMMDLGIDEYGFLKSGHPLLQATSTTLDGVYIAGCAAGPCDVATSVTRGQSAVGDAISKLVPGRKIDLEVMTSAIDEEKCSGCKLCITVCPYNAVSFDLEKKICIVNEVICRGCGTCTASCPSGASKAKHYTDEQINAEIGGILNG